MLQGLAVHARTCLLAISTGDAPDICFAAEKFDEIWRKLSDVVPKLVASVAVDFVERRVLPEEAGDYPQGGAIFVGCLLSDILRDDVLGFISPNQLSNCDCDALRGL